MHINSNTPATPVSGRSTMAAARDQTAMLSVDKSRSFESILSDVSNLEKSAPVTSEKPGISSASGKIITETQSDQEIPAQDEEPESPPLPEMSANARNRFEQLIADITAHPEWAESWLEMWATDSQGGQLFTLSCHPPRYVESGEIYTPETQKYLFSVASLYVEGRKKLYESELAKGTPMLEIVEKVFRYNCTMPEDFRKIAGW